MHENVPDCPYYLDSDIDVYTNLNEVQWAPINYLKLAEQIYEYRIILPRPLANWDVWDYWERERIHSMREHLRQGMVLYDVGTEQGWCNLIYAKFVGPQNMVLIEPTKEFWPNIKATWEQNFGCEVPPYACYAGLLSDKITDSEDLFLTWPDSSVGPLIDRNKYQHLYDHHKDVKEITLDALTGRSGIVPDAITMDVEGAELLVLQGAESTLKKHHPLVWVSIHPDMMERDYGNTADQLHGFMEGIGYTGTHLATDHEEHWIYQSGILK